MSGWHNILSNIPEQRSVVQAYVKNSKGMEFSIIGKVVSTYLEDYIRSSMGNKYTYDQITKWRYIPTIIDEND